MSSTHLVIGDCHAHPEHHNERATWLSKLIIDVKPDVVINIGDNADMPSLSSYDKGKKSFVGRTYQKDINSHLEFQSRLWEPIRSRKKRLPYRVFLVGNHEHRISRAIEVSPELEGAIGLSDLELDEFYDDTVDYSGNTPGTIVVDGVLYSHFLVSGISGRPLSTVHQGFDLLTKNFRSCTVGHTHLFDYCVRSSLDGNRIHGLSVGCYQDYDSDWAGEVNRFWSRGIVIKRNVEDGDYDLQWVSLESLRKEYG